MTKDKPLPTARDRIGDVAPKLVDLTEKVLFGDIWSAQACPSATEALSRLVRC
jgi:alkylhydroperoxidase/carboxymuconolactone decarboxylase family protein YurZ